MRILSPEFENNAAIPGKFTCDGENVNPRLVIEGIPAQAKSLALIVDDPDAPRGVWVHWVVYDMPVSAAVAENSVPGKQGINDSGKQDYDGPCPPYGSTHRYFFKVYALDTLLNLAQGISKEDLEQAMRTHILAEAKIVGLYGRQK